MCVTTLDCMEMLNILALCVMFALGWLAGSLR